MTHLNADGFVQKFTAANASQNVSDCYENENFYPADGLDTDMNDLEYSELFGIKSKKDGGPGLVKGLVDKYQSGKSERQSGRDTKQTGRQNKRSTRKSGRVLRAEEKARQKALRAGANKQQADAAAEQAGNKEAINEQAGNLEVQSGYQSDGSFIPEADKKAVTEPKFWKDMPTFGKVLIVGGGTIALGLLIWGIAIKAKK